MPFQEDREDEVDDQQQTAEQDFCLAGQLPFSAELLELRFDFPPGRRIYRVWPSVNCASDRSHAAIITLDILSFCAAVCGANADRFRHRVSENQRWRDSDCQGVYAPLSARNRENPLLTSKNLSSSFCHFLAPEASSHTRETYHWITEYKHIRLVKNLTSMKKPLRN